MVRQRVLPHQECQSIRPIAGWRLRFLALGQDKGRRLMESQSGGMLDQRQDANVARIPYREAERGVQAMNKYVPWNTDCDQGVPRACAAVKNLQTQVKLLPPRYLRASGATPAATSSCPAETKLMGATPCVEVKKCIFRPRQIALLAPSLAWRTICSDEQNS